MWTNNITLYGRICVAPKEYGFKENAEKVVVFRITAMGRTSDDFLWIDCCTFGRCAESCLAKLRKGDDVCVSGRLISKKYTKRDGSEAESWSINCKEVQFFLPPKQEEKPEEVDLDSVPF